MDVSEATRQLVSCQFNIDVLGIVGSWQKKGSIITRIMAGSFRDLTV